MSDAVLHADDLNQQGGQRPPGHAPLRQAAYDRIEDLLNEGVLKPGQVVSQRELVEKTGATLGAVRETIPRLEAEGLLQTLPKRGLMVPSLDIAFVRDAYQLRAMIEMSAVPHALKFLQAEEIDAWIAAHQEARTSLDCAADPDLSSRLQRLDWAMHARLVGMMGNALIDNVYRVTAIKIRMAVQSRIRVTPSNALRVIGEHLAFLEAMRDGRETDAIAALKKHIDNSLTLALGGSL
ncbi:GntR family transcriptional regulator [Sinorhizobium alkalisoli]|uniref:GntR family transcriptional regulator n=1 Tax=Sinorhizobium alkalisoli TaxID=1752398 RepID=UPI0009F42AFA|nr:GntR family transcriptional regulator [Sinorhizobium alkalisoli]MCA1492440.1 GntR family transcriptional regulator [Ensifer sp. NBAIM29]QFI67583.1 Transcriptional regulator, GntR family [Sinorhizobium alkalisoli]